MFGAREGVSEGVIDPAPDELPGPQNLDGMLWGAIKGVGKGGLGGIDIDSSVEPAGDQASDIASELGGGNAAAPRGEDVRGKVAEGGGGFRSWLGAGLFVGRGIRGSSPRRRPCTVMVDPWETPRSRRVRVGRIGRPARDRWKSAGRERWVRRYECRAAPDVVSGRVMV